MAEYAALSTEIDRITTSPYPSQLRTLHAVVLKCSDADISQWAASKPCLVDPLASCLIEGLQQWSYVLDLITRFALNAACRDAILRQEPTLLHSVVANAIKTGDARSKYTRASGALLSRPLPDTVALPAEAQTLFVQLFEDAASKPSAATIEPIYIILTGTGSLLLGILSTSTLMRFESHMLDILKNVSQAADQSLSLFCLSIMNVVLCGTNPQFRLTNSSYDTQDFLASTPVSSRWKSETMQQFFEGSKAQRSVQLISLLVLSALKAPHCTDDKIKSVILANEVIMAIPADLRKIWCTANTITLRRMQEGLCAHDIDPRIRTLGLRFMGKLCEVDSLSHIVLEKLEATFMDPSCMQVVHTLAPHVNDCELFSSVLAHAPIGDLLQNAVNYAIRADGEELAAALDAISRTMQDALTIIEDHKITVHQVREVLNDGAFLKTLQVLHDKISKREDNEQQSNGWCQVVLHRKRSNLAHQITNLLLRASQKSSIGTQSMTLLLDLHASSARGAIECNHTQPSWREHLTFGTSNGVADGDHVDWREALRTHFRARAEVEQDAVTTLFARACASLEARCENVEKPLREEQERCRALEEQNRDLAQEFAEMESRNVDFGIQVRSLQDERESYMQDLEESRGVNSDLLDRIDGLEERLRRAHDEAQQQLRDLRSERSMVELDSASAIARKQEELDDLQEQFDKSRKALEETSDNLSHVQNELRDSRSERERLERSLSAGEGRIADMEDCIRELETANGSLSTSNGHLQEELQSAKSSDAEREERISDFRVQLERQCSEQANLQQALDEQSNEAKHLRNQLERKTHEATNLLRQHQKSTETLERQLSDLQRESLEDHESLTAELQQRDTKIDTLRQKVDRLQRKCDQKDAQIAEAEAMRANLMAAMGISHPPPVSRTSSLPHRSRESIAASQLTQAPEMPPPAMTGGTDTLVQDSQNYGEESFISNASSLDDVQAGPTPKRPRSRKSAPAPTSHLRASIGTRSSLRSRQSVGGGGNGRVALQGISGNHGRMSVRPFKTPTKEVRMNDEVGIKTFEPVGEDESTFDGSELFMGTQGERLVGLGEGL
jgi:predicted  nucleic acid-binding Zn-ribbon protein